MPVARLGRVVGVDVRVRVYPDHVQVFVLLETGQNRRTRDGVVATQTERLGDLVARLVQLEVAVG
jgi:hypothetical protein